MQFVQFKRPRKYKGEEWGEIHEINYRTPTFVKTYCGMGRVINSSVMRFSEKNNRPCERCAQLGAKLKKLKAARAGRGGE